MFFWNWHDKDQFVNGARTIFMLFHPQCLIFIDAWNLTTILVATILFVFSKSWRDNSWFSSWLPTFVGQYWTWSACSSLSSPQETTITLMYRLILTVSIIYELNLSSHKKKYNSVSRIYIRALALILNNFKIFAINILICIP